MSFCFGLRPFLWRLGLWMISVGGKPMKVWCLWSLGGEPHPVGIVFKVSAWAGVVFHAPPYVSVLGMSLKIGTYLCSLYQWIPFWFVVIVGMDWFFPTSRGLWSEYREFPSAPSPVISFFPSFSVFCLFQTTGELGFSGTAQIQILVS